MYRFLGIHFSRWLFILWPLRYLMRIHVRPEGLNAERLKEMSKGRHVVYVLPRMYMVDAFVLNLCLGRLKVPRIRLELMPGKPRVASLIALRAKNKWLTRRPGKDLFTETVAKFLAEDKRVEKDNVVLMPVSVFWGRAAERSGRNPVMRFLFPDDTHATSFQKILMLLFHLRNIHVHFGGPISPSEMVGGEQNISPQEGARRIRRLLLIDFNRERTMALGPALYELDGIAKWIMRSKETQKLIAEGSGGAEKARRKIQRYLKEIAANYNVSTVRTLELLFDFIWTRIFRGVRVRNFDKIVNYAKTGQIIWMPCHRSHLDYLLLSYVLFKKGLVAPHIAAGVNLSFWPAGPVLRRGGAFFLRRSIAGNRLYSYTFAQYVHFLMHQGFPVEFFQEGGRSRIGKLLSPKTGLLSWCVSSILKRRAENTYVIPVYFGYDKVMEDDTYARELSGAKKQKESFLQLLGSVRYLFSNYGRVDVSFGEPIRFGDAWKSFFSNADEAAEENGPPIPTRLDEISDELDTRDVRVQKFIRYLSLRVNEHINAAATASSSSVLTSALLAQTEVSIEREKLANRISMLHWIVNRTREFIPWDVATSASSDARQDFELKRTEESSKDEPVSLVPLAPSKNLGKIVDEVIEDGVRWGFLTVANDKPGVLKKNPLKDMNLWWYRGTIFHVVAVVGLVSSFVLDTRNARQNAGLEKTKIIEMFELIRRIWEEELYWPMEIDSTTLAMGGLGILAQLGVLRDHNGQIFADSGEVQAETLRFLAELVRPECELYSMQLAMAQSLVDLKGGFSKDEIIKGTTTLHRAAFLRGVASQPATHSKVFGGRTFDALVKCGIFSMQGKNTFALAFEDYQLLTEFFDFEMWREFIS